MDRQHALTRLALWTMEVPYPWVAYLPTVGQHDLRIKTLNKSNTYNYVTNEICHISKLSLNICLQSKSFSTKPRYKHYASKKLIPSTSTHVCVSRDERSVNKSINHVMNSITYFYIRLRYQCRVVRMILLPMVGRCIMVHRSHSSYQLCCVHTHTSPDRLSSHNNVHVNYNYIYKEDTIPITYYNVIGYWLVAKRKHISEIWSVRFKYVEVPYNCVININNKVYAYICWDYEN